MTSGEVVATCDGTSDECHDVAFVCEGERTACVAKDGKTIILFDDDGNITTKVRGHSSWILNMCVVPHTNQLLTAGDDNCYLFNIPPFSEQHDEDEDTTAHGAILSCCILPSGDEFITLSEKGRLQKWTTQTCETTSVYAEVQGVYGESSMVLHPCNDVVVVNTSSDLLWYSTTTVQLLATHKVIDEGVDEDEDDSIRDVIISQDGTKCVVAKRISRTTEVFDITDLYNITTITTYTMEGNMYSSDIHHDGERVVSAGDDGVHVWNISTSQHIHTLKTIPTRCVRFVGADHIMCVYYYDGYAHLMTVHGEDLHKFPGDLTTDYSFTLYNKNNRLMTGNKDNSIQIHDVNTKQTLYTFPPTHYPPSEGFACFSVQGDVVCAWNRNGKIYVFKTSPNMN